LHVVDVDAVDADESDAGVDEQLGSRLAEERGGVAVRATLPGLRAVRLLDDPYQVVFPELWVPVIRVEALLARPWIDGPPGSAVHRALDRIAATMTPRSTAHTSVWSFPQPSPSSQLG
jgi:hypothetical protein